MEEYTTVANFFFVSKIGHVLPEQCMKKYLRCRKCATFSVVFLGFHSWKFCTGQSDLNIYNRFEMVKFINESIWNPCETLNRYRVWKTTFASILGFHVWFSGCCPWTKIILMLNLKRGSNFAVGRPQHFCRPDSPSSIPYRSMRRSDVSNLDSWTMAWKWSALNTWNLWETDDDFTEMANAHWDVEGFKSAKVVSTSIF